MGASGVIGGVKGKVQVGWLVRETWERPERMVVAGFKRCRVAVGGLVCAEDMGEK